jgi:hypothetical protein
LGIQANKNKGYKKTFHTRGTSEIHNRNFPNQRIKKLALPFKLSELLGEKVFIKYTKSKSDF